MQKPFDVRNIKDEPLEPLADEIEQIAGATRPTPLVLTTGSELDRMKIIRSDSGAPATLTFVEDGGYCILRITNDGKSQDLVLNIDQIKLLLRQMVEWITR